MGAPPVLALTATADGDVSNYIMDAFNISNSVFDETPRLNLVIDDQRNTKKALQTVFDQPCFIRRKNNHLR